MANRTILIRAILTGDNKELVHSLAGADKAAQKTTHHIDEVGHASKRAHGAISGLAGAVGIGGLAFGIKDVVQAGMQWQTQQAQLQSSLRATGLASASTLKSINAAVEQSATHGGFAPSVETSGIAQFIGETHSATKAIALNNEVIAVARRTGKDYAGALSLVERAQTGQARGLSKYIGIVIPVTDHVRALTSLQKKLHPELLRQAQLLDKQSTAAEVNARIMKVLGGATSAYGKTAAGSLSNASNSFELMKEQLGRAFLPIVTKVGQELAKLAGWMERNRSTVLAVIEVVGGLTVVLGTLVAVTKVYTAVQTALDVVMNANPIGAVILAITALVAAVIYAYTHFRAFRAVVDGVFSWLRTAVQAVVGFFKKHWELLGGIVAGPLGIIVLTIVKHFGEIKKFIGGVIDWVAARFEWLWRKIKGVVDTVTGLPSKALGAVGHVASGIVHTASFGLFNEGGPVHAFASGGAVHGPSGRDKVPAYLTDGEYVLKPEVVRAIGISRLNAINANATLAPSEPGYVTLPIVLKVGERVLAQTTVRQQLRAASLA
jgi:hypothetical protein